MFEYFLLPFQYSCEKNYGSSKSPRHGYLNPPLLEQFEPKVKGCSSLSKERGGNIVRITSDKRPLWRYLPASRFPRQQDYPPCLEKVILRYQLDITWMNILLISKTIARILSCYDDLSLSLSLFPVISLSFSLSLFLSWKFYDFTQMKQGKNDKEFSRLFFLCIVILLIFLYLFFS